MGTRKDYAISLGLATAGRGRMSREALAAVEKAIAEGYIFDDMPGTTKPTSKPRKASQPVSKPVKASAPKSKNVRPEGVPEENEYGVPWEPPREYPPIPDLPVINDIEHVWAWDEKIRCAIATEFCGCHGRHVKYCNSKEIQLPAYLGGGPALMEKP